MTDLTRSIVRSVTPIAVGLGISILAHFGIKSPDVVATIGSVTAAAYAAGVRALEHKYPKVGKLLGVAGAPTYTK